MKTPRPRPVPDRQCLQGILYVLHTGIGWEGLPQELGFRPGMTCWRRIKRRIKRRINAGVFDGLRQILLAQLNAANEVDWSRAVIDGSHIDTKRGSRALSSPPFPAPT
nr:transposase [Streptomyces caniscabiei]